MYDVVIIGGGPGGYAAGLYAHNFGLSVALVEKDPTVGGTCLLRGCIPAKHWLHTAEVFTTVREAGSGNGVEWTLEHKRRSAANEIAAPRIEAYVFFGMDHDGPFTTPAEAVRLGSDYLVIGRPVTGADDPPAALQLIREEIASIG